jgi:hypothetical protein
MNPDVSSLARWIIIFGISLAVFGGILLVLNRAGLPLGKLPGDFRFQTGKVGCFFPLATSILLSILLTILFNLILRWLGK